MKTHSCLLVSGCLVIATLFADKVSAVDFRFQINAEGTTQVVAHPAVDFTWTVVGTATETWTTTSLGSQTVTAAVSGGTHSSANEKKYFTPAGSGTMTVSWSAGVVNAAWGVQVFDSNNRNLFTATQDSPHSTTEAKLSVVQGMTYYLWVGVTGQGSVSATVSYPAMVTKQNQAIRTANYAAPATISQTDGRKFIAPIPFAAYPLPQKGGTMLAASFQVSNNSARVETWVDGASVLCPNRLFRIHASPLERD